MVELEKVSDLKQMVNFASNSYGTKDAYRYKVKKAIETKSFSDIKKDSEAFSLVLQSFNMIGKHVAVVGPTSYEWIITYLGTVNSQSVIVPIDKELPQTDIIELLERADVSVFVFDKEYKDVALAAKEKCPMLEILIGMGETSNSELVYSFWECIHKNEGSFELDIDREALCTILYTSGTTGKSKGVMLSHRNLIENVTCTDMGIDREHAVTLSVLPIHHAYCFTCEILLGIYLGITVCINDSLMRIAKNIALFQPSIFVAVPLIIESVYHKLSEAIKAAESAPKAMVAMKLKIPIKKLTETDNLSKVIVKAVLGENLTTIYSGGAYLNPDLIKEFKKFDIDLVQGYGMSECSPLISTNFVYDAREKSVGKLVPGCEAKIVDEEIYVKSPSVMMGYYKNEEETKQTLIDGWLRTGDLGYIDEENYLYITGRKKNLIILPNGENVSPEELENKLGPEPLIAEVLVYDENNIITAEIFPDYEYAKKHKIKQIKESIQEIIDTVNEKEPMFKQIHAVKIREVEFEKTTSKKIKRYYNTPKK